MGIRGSSYIGSPVLSDIDSASIAPDGKWIFVTREGRPLFVRGLSDPAPADGLIDAVDLVGWSSDASFAVLYSSSAGLLQRVRLTADQVAPEKPADINPWGAVTALAIDPSGRRIAFGVAGSGIHLVEDSKSPYRVLSMPSPAAVAFADNGRFYAVDGSTGLIAEFAPDLSPSEFAVVETAGGSGAWEPVGLAVSANGARLIVADRGSRTVLIYETATRTLMNTIGLDHAPSGIDRLSSSSYLLNRPRGKEWLLVLDATDTPAVYFVPAAEENSR